MQKVSEVMSTDVHVISPDATIEEAAQEMRDGDFGLLPVAEDEDEQLLGVITDRDIAVRAVAEGKDPDTSVGEVMSEGVIWVEEDDSIEDAAQIMSDHQIRRLPVVDADKRLVGIVSLGDFAVDSADIGPVAEALTDISSPP
ncbi:CBS domain-containing protein [Nitrosospira briensis]|uniref:CBS domain-containing protein n=1 Tax=Nitrosospira briensis TaxID=35799 RepID=A0A1I4XZC6_9PROT|nr:CBS domain-containing protein [Nitrosospira briensis]SFN30599.1 CBS domain-containing protein [Nitrosospira briensis]SFN66636.1 CBS domain-containing protein [Nitrosospira briensis]